MDERQDYRDEGRFWLQALAKLIPIGIGHLRATRRIWLSLLQWRRPVLRTVSRWFFFTNCPIGPRLLPSGGSEIDVTGAGSYGGHGAMARWISKGDASRKRSAGIWVVREPL